MSNVALKDKVYNILKKDNRLWGKDAIELNKRALFDLVDDSDEYIIRVLFEHQETKLAFFTNVNDAFIFKSEEFKLFIETNSVHNTYTGYLNRIGLSDGIGLINDTGKVVLNYPYKDCILAGGQSTEEGLDVYYKYEEEKEITNDGEKEIKPAGYKKLQSRREEIFFNQIVAKDEIDRLFDEKGFVNWKRISKDGENENIGEIKRDAKGLIRENLIIRGNNLLSLHSIKSQFHESVKLIYIDPPYNTGNDEFKYNDDFNHSTWLTFMKNRLDIAKEFLRKDGAIFIQVDDNEMAYLKVLCDEIFGRKNFKECISVKTGSESGVNAINVMRGEQLFKVKEYILYYAKDYSVHKFKPMYVKAMNFNMSYKYEVRKEGEAYSVKDTYKDILNKLYDQDTLRGLSEEQKGLFRSKFEQYCLSNSEHMYALKTDIQKAGDNFKRFAEKNKKKCIVEEYHTSDGRVTLTYKGGMLTPLKDRIVEENGKKYYGTLISDFWWDIGATPSSEGGVILKSGKKPEKLLKRIISLCTDKNDIVMDFFLGSGTTAATALKMNRRFIGIEQLNYGSNDSVARLKNVFNDTNEESKNGSAIKVEDANDFICCELAKWNEQAIEEIHKAKDFEMLKSLFDELYEKYFLKYNVKIKEFKEKIMQEIEFCELSLDEQKHIFQTMLDLNQLYIHKTEMMDEKYAIAQKDQDLTKKFYANY